MKGAIRGPGDAPPDGLTATADPGYGWLIVATLGVTEAVSYGVLSYAFGVLLVPMQRDLGWSRVELSGAFSLAILTAALAIVPVGRLLDRVSPRLTMTAGSTLAAVMVLVWSRVGTRQELYLVFLGLGLAMALVLYESAFVVVTKWFRVRRSAAITTLTLIAACSSFVFSPLTERLVDSFGWRGAVAALALILGAITIPLHGLVLRGAPSGGSPAQPDVTGPRAPHSATRTVAFWLIVGAFALSPFATTAMAVHLVPLLVGLGDSPALAAFAAGVMGISQIPGRLVFALAGRLGPALRCAAIFGLAAVALGSLACGSSGQTTFVFVVGFGMSNGMLTLLRATLIGDIYGRAEYGAISGVANAFALAACAAAPLGAAFIAGAPGGYGTLLVTLIGFSCLAGLASARGVTLARRAVAQS